MEEILAAAQRAEGDKYFKLRIDSIEKLMLPACKNCGHAVNNKYCPECGQKAFAERFTLKILAYEFIHGFYHVDHGILYTIKELAINPGQMLKDYLLGKRKKHFNPFSFILIIAGVLSVFLPKLISRSLFVEMGLFDVKSLDPDLLQSSLENFSMRIIFGLPLFAIVTTAFYRQKQFNFSENLVANSYLRGESQLLLFVLVPLFIINRSSTMIIGAYVGYLAILLLYYAWAYCVMFEDKIAFRGFAKGFICALVSQLLEVSIVNLLLLKKLPFKIHF